MAYGAPAYGTHMPNAGDIHTGLQTYQVFDRDLDGNNGAIESAQYLFLLSYGITDWLSIDLKGGVGNITQNPNAGDAINYPTFVGGGYGFRLRLYEDEANKAVFGFQHISIHPYSVDLSNGANKAVLDDWQLSFLGSHKFKNVTPYAGFRWSRMDYIHWIKPDRNRIKSDLDKSFGVITGMDWFLTEKIWVNVEGNFVDAQAVSASVNYKF